MKKIFFTILLLILISPLAYSQRIVFQSDFETDVLNSDSLPSDWIKFDMDGHNPSIKWAVRDTSVHFGGGNTRPRAIGKRSLEIPWYAGSGGNNVNDDWVYTSLFQVQTGDSLIFSMLIGSDTTFQAYLDSMEVRISVFQDPNLPSDRIAKIVSNDSAGIPLNNNDWTVHKFSLNAYVGQTVSLIFRYYMNITNDGLWCNIDNVFIGNHSAIGIHPISNNLPKQFDLRQNYPNPFNPITNIEFSLPKASFTTLKVYDVLGREVRNLVNETLKPGVYKVDFDASDLPSGAYFYRLETVDFVKTNKMILTK